MFFDSDIKPPLGGLSLYVHVPFCRKKCPYCAFESAVPSSGDYEIWLKSIKKEFSLWKNHLGKQMLNTCYFGGGTPTVLSNAVWRELLDSIQDNFCFARDAEVTVEANPNSLTASHLLLWKDWRVTRVSIGVQSFDDTELEMLGRLHTARKAHDAISAVLASGFSASIDLMFGLPYQTFKNWGRNLKEAVMSGVSHISLYQLSLEIGTPWENMSMENALDGYAPYRWAQWYLPRKGLDQYEIANFAVKGKESRHNLNYWRNGDYIGAGPGASGFINGFRYKNKYGTRDYAKLLENNQSPICSVEKLPHYKAANEAAVLALRTIDGIDKREFEKRYGNNCLRYISDKMKTFPSSLYQSDENRICLTKNGMRVANAIWRELI